MATHSHRFSGEHYRFHDARMPDKTLLRRDVPHPASMVTGTVGVGFGPDGSVVVDDFDRVARHADDAIPPPRIGDRFAKGFDDEQHVAIGAVRGEAENGTVDDALIEGGETMQGAGKQPHFPTTLYGCLFGLPAEPADDGMHLMPDGGRTSH